MRRSREEAGYGRGDPYPLARAAVAGILAGRDRRQGEATASSLPLGEKRQKTFCKNPPKLSDISTRTEISR
jgi:hypothetical protein